MVARPSVNVPIKPQIFQAMGGDLAQHFRRFKCPKCKLTELPHDAPEGDGVNHADSRVKCPAGPAPVTQKNVPPSQRFAATHVANSHLGPGHSRQVAGRDSAFFSVALAQRRLEEMNDLAKIRA
jgi:hypothetical protein